MDLEQQNRWVCLKRLPTDYAEYGGSITRWGLPDAAYPDCSCGCKYWRPLHDSNSGRDDGDWGVCVSPQSPRSGLLTWEHQAGFQCFESCDAE